MIIQINLKINDFSKNNLKKFKTLQDFIQSLMPCYEDIHCCCPKCGASRLVYHASYKRNLTIIYKGKRYDIVIIVARVICKSCKSTHALLPNFIVPYKLYTRDSILAIAEEGFSSSAIKVADKSEVSMQLVYGFMKLLLNFFSYADSLNREKNWYKDFTKEIFSLNCVKICNKEFNNEFFKRYKWIFLMTKFQNMKTPPVYIGVNLIAST